MKGPYERLKYDLRRVWECPACKRRERTAGTVTFRHCPCRIKQLDGQPVVMTLVEDGVQRITPPKMINHPATVVPEPAIAGPGHPESIADDAAPKPDASA